MLYMLLNSGLTKPIMSLDISEARWGFCIYDPHCLYGSLILKTSSAFPQIPPPIINPKRYALSVFIYFYCLKICSIIADATFWAKVTGTAFPITLYIAVMFLGVSSINKKSSGND